MPTDDLGWLDAALLGFIQGATEFLPVSSSGHLVMGQALLGLDLPGVLFEVVVHLATLISVLVVYRGRIAELVTGMGRGEGDSFQYVGLLALATFPAALIGLLFRDPVEEAFASPYAVGFALLVTGAVLFSTRWALRERPEVHIGWRIALLVGIAQAFALIPGISRSGSTVVMALWLGVSPVKAATFSFLMSVPVIAGAGALMIPELGLEGGLASGPLLIAAAVAAVTGILAIRTFVAMLRDRSFPHFAWYCWGAGIAFLLWLRATGA